jgi:hypothetical protein
MGKFSKIDEWRELFGRKYFPSNQGVGFSADG